jgi:hypothetical protein
MFFLLFLPDDRRIRIRDPYLSLMNPDPGGPKTYGSYGSYTGGKNKKRRFNGFDIVGVGYIPSPC